MLSMRQWRHERSVKPDGESKTVVRDRITFQLRLPLRPLTPIITVGIRALFGHRHRRLQRHFANGD
jgi:ligand-binding SRPBCC domain-containing protein